MTTPRPYSQQPDWIANGVTLVVGGVLAALVGLVVGWNEAVLSGMALAGSGVVITIAATVVW